MTFRIGQKVVFVCDKIPPGSTGPDGEAIPRLGSVYTVRGHGGGRSGPGIYLEEIINPIVETFEGRMERYYENWGFRPIIERKTDISIFTAMLKTERQPVLTEQ